MPSFRSLHSSAWIALLSLIFPNVAAAADEQKIIRLEQDVRKLERLVQDQARQIEDLRRQLRRPGLPSLQSDSPDAEVSSRWLTIANWQRVRPGMSELEVIDALGPPTSMRVGDNDSRILLYAIEIGAAGFLSGNVTLKERKVVEVQAPALR